MSTTASVRRATKPTRGAPPLPKPPSRHGTPRRKRPTLLMPEDGPTVEDRTAPLALAWDDVGTLAIQAAHVAELLLDAFVKRWPPDFTAGYHDCARRQMAGMLQAIRAFVWSMEMNTEFEWRLFALDHQSWYGDQIRELADRADEVFPVDPAGSLAAVGVPRAQLVNDGDEEGLIDTDLEPVGAEGGAR